MWVCGKPSNGRYCFLSLNIIIIIITFNDIIIIIITFNYIIIIIVVYTGSRCDSYQRGCGKPANEVLSGFPTIRLGAGSAKGGRDSLPYDDDDEEEEEHDGYGDDDDGDSKGRQYAK